MLDYLHLKNVGPAPEMRMDLAPRLNVITGDNGLGKSFLLDIAWWALTRTWASYPARPPVGSKETAVVDFTLQGKTKPVKLSCRFDRKAQTWRRGMGRPPNPGLVLYARVDGGFAVWDPARNYWWDSDNEDRPSAYVFDSRQVWDGLRTDGRILCGGLISDWAKWQGENGRAFKLLEAALRVMSPTDDEPLVPGELTRIRVGDAQDMPTLRMPYGQDVPIVHASAGVRRIAALSYLLVWSWQEHLRDSKLRGEEPSKQITFLVDEIDAHLHPRWQRVVLKSLLSVVNELMTGGEAEVQVLAASHSPLVLASLEPVFDEDRDSLWHLAQRGRVVTLDEVPWTKQGDVVGWLVSDIFGLKQARSAEAEQAIEAAEAFMRHDLAGLPQGLRTKTEIDKKLRELLPGQDPFWPRWLVETGLVGGTRRNGKAR